MQTEYHKILNKYWGYSDFRSIQWEVISSIVSGKDTLALMPTGGGKSITFQVPAMYLEGTCIVVTPLIALMTDQVARLKGLNIKAAALHSGLNRHEMKIMLDNAMYGAYKILYISPERLMNESFRERLKYMKVSFIAVDEAHCISQWGYDFRPSYLGIAKVREILTDIPILALTATATPEVADDIQLRLKFKSKNLISSDFTRKNLVYFVRQTEGKMDDLVKSIQSVSGTGIVYVRSRKKTREYAEMLRQEGIRADFYHAGMNYEVRERKQNDWMEGKIRIMVTTNAFGMGIDKPDVRLVVHMDMPDSLEEYFQEAGRAGRDGKKSFAVILSSSSDKVQLKKRLTNSFPELDFIKKVYQALCNYLAIPIGGGKGIAYEFKLDDFVKAYKFNSLHAYNAIKLLEQQGYLELTNELNNPSRVYFSINRDDLYNFQVKNAGFDGFIKLVLRSYTGLFSDYVSLNEDILAHRAGLTREMVYDYFVKLARLNIINYIPGKRTSLIVFLEERLQESSLYLSPENYIKRKERYEKRIGAMLHYSYSSDTCRSVLLLNYFGQKGSVNCGHCDVCKNKERVYTTEQVKVLKEKVLNKFKDNAVFPDELARTFKEDSRLLSMVVRELLEEELIAYNSEGQIGIFR